MASTVLRSGFALIVVLVLWGCDVEGDGRPQESQSGTVPARPEGAASEATTASPGTSAVARSEPSGRPVPLPAVVFFGTSLTAGYGLDDRGDAFPGLIREKIDSVGLDYRVVDAGVPGETSAAGLRRIGWVLDRSNVAVLVLELGANDGLRGQNPEALRDNLQAAIDSTRAHDSNATIVLAGMEAPPNLGPRYTEEFRRIFREVARSNDVELIPFLLEGVAGVAELNQSDRIHPNVEGHRMVAGNVWEVLAPLLASE